MTFEDSRYPKYDNYDAINVDKVKEIPFNYFPCWYKCPHRDICLYAQTEGEFDNEFCPVKCNGKMGVPITFMDRYYPGEFEILDKLNPVLNGKNLYSRIIIKRTRESVDLMYKN